MESSVCLLRILKLWKTFSYKMGTTTTPPMDFCVPWGQIVYKFTLLFVPSAFLGDICKG